MTTIIEKLESSHYVANEAQVEALAHESYKANSQARRADGVYLRVLIAGCQAKLGPRRRGAAMKAEAQFAVIEATHERYYAAVLRGVTTSEVAHDDTLDQPERTRRMLERNRRSGFARSAKSAVFSFVKAGGDVRGLDVAAVTKSFLLAQGKPAEPTDKVARQISRAEVALTRALRRQARASPDAARESIERAMAELQKVLDSLDEAPEHGATTTIVAGREARHTRTRAGTPAMLHRGA